VPDPATQPSLKQDNPRWNGPDAGKNRSKKNRERITSGPTNSQPSKLAERVILNRERLDNP